MSRAAMQQALEALEGFDHFRRIMTDGPDESDKVFAEDHAEVAFVTAARVIPALKQALSEPEQEPVAWMQEMPVSGNEERSVRMTTVKMVADEWDNPIPLYTAPTPRKPQREHITDGSPCWCNPDVIEEEGGNVIVHNYEDNWQQYAKPGETAQQCIERHRAEQDALMKLYATPRKPQTTHWEGCEAVHPECRAKTELERKSDAIQRLWKERDELRALNAELVEALRWYVDEDDVIEEMEGNEYWVDGRDRALAALAKVEASK